MWVDEQATFEPELPIVPAIGSPRRRALVERLEREGRSLATLVHPSAVVARSAILEPGCVIFPNVVIGARTRIGRGTIVNRGALIGHHTIVGAHAFVGPGANIAGGVRIGDEAYIGLGAIVRDDRTIGAGATVGAGAVVVGDVEPGVTVIGLPARPHGASDERRADHQPRPDRAWSRPVPTPRTCPLTPEEVAADVRRCRDAGASIVHLHPRDESGEPTQSPERAAAFIAAVRAVVPDIVVVRHDQRARATRGSTAAPRSSTSTVPSGRRWPA